MMKKILSSDYKIINELGYGMFGTVYQIQMKTNKKKYALKIQHVEKKDLLPNSKSLIWREINFSINFANKYPKQFIKLEDYDFLNDCELKQKYYCDITTLPLKLQKIINKLKNSPFCSRKVYELVNGDLSDKLNSQLSCHQLYSLIIQLTFAIQLMHKHNYVHGDIHNGNVGWIKTSHAFKIKIGNQYVKTLGYLFKLIDYGMVVNKSELVGKKEKIEFDYNYKNELFLLVHFMVDRKIYDYINSNKININFYYIYKEFKSTKFYPLIKKYSDDKIIQMFLFDILFPDIYQKIAFGSTYTKTIQRKLYIPFEDILYFICNYTEPNKIIKYFNNKLNN